MVEFYLENGLYGSATGDEVAGVALNARWQSMRVTRIGMIAGAMLMLIVVACGVSPITSSRTDLRVIAAGSGPDALAITPDGRTLYVANGGDTGRGDTVTPVTVATGIPRQPIRVGKTPFAMAMTPNGRTLYVALSDGAVMPIVVASGRLGRAIRVRGGVDSLAISPNGRTLYIGGSSQITPVDAATGTPGKAIRFRYGARNEAGPMAISPNGRTLYVLGDSTVVSVTTSTGQMSAPIPVGSQPVSLAITPDGRKLCVSVDGDIGPDVPGVHKIVTIDIAMRRVEPAVALSHGAVAMVVSPDGRTLYLAQDFAGTVTPVNIENGRVGAPISVSKGSGVAPQPTALAITPDGSTLYVANQGNDTVAVIPLTPR